MRMIRIRMYTTDIRFTMTGKAHCVLKEPFFKPDPGQRRYGHSVIPKDV
jgi:hypothetical protein